MTDTDEKDWYRNYGIHIRDKPTEIMAIEELISRVMNVQNLNRTKAIKHIFKAGLKILSKFPCYADAELKEAWGKARFYSRVRLEAARRREFSRAYKDLGPTRLQELAEEEGIDLDDNLDDFLWPVTSRFDRMKRWILEFLGDEPHKIEDIRAAAVRDGILTSPKDNTEQYKRDYQSFKTAASELGVSGSHTKHGEWQKVNS